MAKHKHRPYRAADGSICCGDESWRGHLCQYHQGYEDGTETTLDVLNGLIAEALDARRTRDTGDPT